MINKIYLRYILSKQIKMKMQTKTKKFIIYLFIHFIKFIWNSKVVYVCVFVVL